MRYLVTALVMGLIASGASAVTQNFSEDFEGSWPLSQGWYFANGAGQLVTDQNHTPGGSVSAELTGSIAKTTQTTDPVTNVVSTDGTLDFWFYVDSTNAGYGGAYDIMEVLLKDDNNALCSQTYIRKLASREYIAGGYTVLPEADNVIVPDTWNHVQMDFDYVGGTFTLTLNDSYVWNAPSFGTADGKTGTGIVSYTFVHNNNNGARLFVDDVNLVPEPTTIGLLLAGVAGLLRKRG